MEEVCSAFAGVARDVASLRCDPLIGSDRRLGTGSSPPDILRIRSFRASTREPCEDLRPVLVGAGTGSDSFLRDAVSCPAGGRLSSGTESFLLTLPSRSKILSTLDTLDSFLSEALKREALLCNPRDAPGPKGLPDTDVPESRPSQKCQATTDDTDTDVPV